MNIIKTIFQHRYLAFISIVLVTMFLSSCQEDPEIIVSDGETIALTVSSDDLLLTQEMAYESIFSLSWSRGTNHGTSSSISYVLEMDKAGNNFQTAQVYDLGKGVYEKSFTGETLNNLLIDYWGETPGQPSSFEAKVTSDVTKTDVEDGTSETLSFQLTSYQNVTSELYMVGSAAPSGWDIANATQLTPDASYPWIFTYEGQMKVGNFKFAVNTMDCWCQDFYNMDISDSTKLVLNVGGAGDDTQWELKEGGNYLITLNLIELSIDIEKLQGPAFNELYIIGDASPSGWNIGSPEAFTQSSTDPFVFTYEAVFNPGNFKISTFKGDWCDGQWINSSEEGQALTATDYIVTNNCDGPDNQWTITEETQGRYLITVNQYTKTINIEPVMLYIIGDGGPNGWNIGSPEPMQLVDGIYIFEGELGSDNAIGEIKFSKYKGDWCDGNWIIAATADQSIKDTRHLTRNACDHEDYKWRLVDGDAGTYRITIDLENDTMSIEKQ